MQMHPNHDLSPSVQSYRSTSEPLQHDQRFFRIGSMAQNACNISVRNPVAESLLGSVVRIRRRKANVTVEARVCIVCGEPASGYNFDRLTCESCKAFFRRNALKPRDKIKACSRGGGCDVEGSQRKHCPSCRLEKCFAVGMKRELILPPEKLEQRAKPRRRKSAASPVESNCSPSHQPKLLTGGPPGTRGSRGRVSHLSDYHQFSGSDHHQPHHHHQPQQPPPAQQQQHFLHQPLHHTEHEQHQQLQRCGSLVANASACYPATSGDTRHMNVNGNRMFPPFSDPIANADPAYSIADSLLAPSTDAFPLHFGQHTRLYNPHYQQPQQMRGCSSAAAVEQQQLTTSTYLEAVSAPQVMASARTSVDVEMPAAVHPMQAMSVPAQQERHPPHQQGQQRLPVSGVAHQRRSLASGRFVRCRRARRGGPTSGAVAGEWCRHHRCRRSQLRRQHASAVAYGILRLPPTLSYPDSQMLSSLQECVLRIREPFTPDEQLDTGVAVTLEQEYNRMDACIRRIIRVVKLLPFFSDIDKAAQLILVRANIYGLIVLYSSFFFEENIRKLRYPVLEADGQLTTVTVAMLDEVSNTFSDAETVGSFSRGAQHDDHFAADGMYDDDDDDDCETEEGDEENAEVNRLAVRARAQLMHKSASGGLREEFELYRANSLAAFEHLDHLVGAEDIVRVSVFAIKLFTEDTLPVNMRQAVSNARKTYLLFLWTYLRWRAVGSHSQRLRHATEHYARLLIGFIDLRTLEIRMTEFSKLLSLDGLSPLMREVCSQRHDMTFGQVRE